jgi:CDP-diacylglycerol--glycerol-3-phosphate 3-phosphatidyltransferase
LPAGGGSPATNEREAEMSSTGDGMWTLAPVSWGAENVLAPGLVVVLLWVTQLGYFAVVSHGVRIRRDGSWSPGVANTVTMVRGGLYAVVAGFVLVPPEMAASWIPAACYGTGVVLDRVDGYLARTVGRETALGARLDMAFDTFGFVAAPLVAVVWGTLPVWYLSLSAARFLYRGGCEWRRFRGRPVFDLPESDVRQPLAGIQMLFLTVALVPAVPASLVWAAAPVVLAPSLVVFLRDFLVVSGRLPLDGRVEHN